MAALILPHAAWSLDRDTTNRADTSHSTSDELRSDDPANAKPIYPSGVQLELLEGGRVRVRWRGTGAEDVTSYRVYRSREGTPWELRHRCPADSAQQSFRLIDRLPRRGSYRFAVSSVTRKKVESDRSPPVTVVWK